MGLILIALFVAGALGLATALIGCGLVRLLRQRGWAYVVAFVCGLLVSGVSVIPLFQWLQSATTTLVIGASSDVADQVMAFCEMPPGTAKDFCYWRSLGGTFLVADFRMSEQDYLNWMRSRGWDPQPIAARGSTVYAARDYAQAKTSLVTRGWECSWSEPDNPDSTETYTYDAQTGRVYVFLTAW